MIEKIKSSVKVLLFSVLMPLLFSACETVSVSRVASSEQTDVSGYWNDTDVRIVCDALIEDCINSPRIAAFTAKKGNLPVFIVGKFKNDSSEHIDTSIIVKKMQSAIIKSGKADFVADRFDREAVREERLDQNKGNASEESAKSIGAELGADFILQGAVKSIIQRGERKTVRTYQVTAELIDIETNRIIWSGFNDDIKKIVTTPNVRF